MNPATINPATMNTEIAPEIDPVFTIRRLEPTDAAGLCALYEDGETYSQTFHLPDPAHYQWEKRLANIPENVHAYVASINKEVVGNVSFTIDSNPCRRHVATLAVAVKSDYGSQGIGDALMTYALNLAHNWLNLKRIELTVFTDNAKAINLFTKHQFEIEGEAKAFAFRNGQYVDAYSMARVREII